MAFQLDDLKESNEFLNALIDNIDSAVFIVDRNIRIQQFNRALQLLLGKSREALIGELCGNAIGCAFAVRENNPCGKTSHCGKCELLHSILKAFVERVPTYKGKLVREFFIRSEPFLKYFEYTTKHILFEGHEMILVIVDDVTESETQKTELIEKQRLINEDLEAAAGIQQSLLPHRLPKTDRLEVAWKFLPCEYIGGDIFNVFHISQDHVGCYILDVSGHGVTSALVTVSVSQVLHPSPLAEILPPAEVCRSLNRDYPIERFGTFITMIYMVINLREGYFVYTNAGHPPLVLMREDGSLELLSRGGSVIGLEEVVPFEQERRELRKGDRLILYTDGLIEQRNSKRELYGEERLYAKLKELKDLSIDDILDGALRSVEAFAEGAKPKDDLSLLGIVYKGNNK
jgi:sigma-B regulation protein RsbU (phosphoserine phosphatase)